MLPSPRKSMSEALAVGDSDLLRDGMNVTTTAANSSGCDKTRTCPYPQGYHSDRGFSLLEMMIVVVIGLLMAGMVVSKFLPLLEKNHVDEAYDMTLSVLRTYRNLAITQSKRYIIIPTAPGTITVQYWGVGVPASPAPVTVSTITLPTDVQFAVQTGFPDPGPDSLSTGTTAIAFNACSVLESGDPCLIFYPNGSAQDDLGNYNSGVLYLTQPSNNLLSSRAIDVFGTTGRIRGWRLYNVSGTNTWEQQ